MRFFKCFFRLILIVLLAVITVWGIYSYFPLKYTNIIRQECASEGVDAYLAAALIKAESGFDAYAVSDAGAKGAMQLTDATAGFCAENLGLTLSEGDIYKPEINIKLGVYFLKRLLDIYDGDEDLAIAAYNAGEGRVNEWLSTPEYSTDGETLDSIPYRETERHIKKIRLYKKVYKLLYPNL